MKMASWKAVWMIAIAALPGIAWVPRAEGIPRPEHPEPQAVRAEWLNLNGSWEFAETNSDESGKYLSAEPYPDRIHVPFCRESALSGLGRKELVKHVWYRRTFSRPPAWKSPRTLLHVGACDWRTTVWVNGWEVGNHTGGSASFAFDITEALREGENTLTIHAFDDTSSGLQALGKQSLNGVSHGIFYTPTTGIWQTVWLEGVGGSFIREFRIEPDADSSQVSIQAFIDGPCEGLTLRAEAFAQGKRVGMAKRPAESRDNSLVLKLRRKRLWSPSDPFLYGLTLTLEKERGTVDQVESYFGLRDVRIEGAAILINNQPIFQRLILDQGFYPEGVWTAPSDDALRKDIDLSMACGFNGARLHQKVFDPRTLYWADRLGYLLWGEFPSFQVDYSRLEVNKPIIDEWIEIVARDRNHPAIIGWCPFNETPRSAADLQATVVALTRAMDPSRPVIETSGWTHTIPHPELLDAHDYDQDPESLRTRWEGFAGGLPERYGMMGAAGVPFFISEYGGIRWSEDANTWGYGSTPKTLDDFYARFKGLADALMDNPRLFGLCYTQLTDVEQECNGLYYYDRRPKFDVGRLHAILSRKAAYELDPPLRVAGGKQKDSWKVLLGALQDGPLAKPWRYTLEQPEGDWTQPSYSAATWQSGLAPFGQKGGWEEKIRTPWTTSDLWLRREFQWDGMEADRAALVMHHDNRVEIFLNGKPLFERGGWNDRYDLFLVTEAFRNLAIAGTNVLAVHIHQDGGGQFFDMALLGSPATIE